MDVKINYISSTDKFDFYTVSFLNFCTGTMQLEKAKKLKAYLEPLETITLPELRKLFRYSSDGIYEVKPRFRRLF